MCRYNIPIDEDVSDENPHQETSDETMAVADEPPPLVQIDPSSHDDFEDGRDFREEEYSDDTGVPPLIAYAGGEEQEAEWPSLDHVSYNLEQVLLEYFHSVSDYSRQFYHCIPQVHINPPIVQSYNHPLNPQQLNRRFIRSFRLYPIVMGLDITIPITGSGGSSTAVSTVLPRRGARIDNINDRDENESYQP